MKKRQNPSKAQGNPGGYSGTVDAAHLDSQDLSSAFMSDSDRKAGAYHADRSSAIATLEAPIESPVDRPGGCLSEFDRAAELLFFWQI